MPCSSSATCGANLATRTFAGTALGKDSTGSVKPRKTEAVVGSARDSPAGLGTRGSSSSLAGHLAETPGRRDYPR